MNKKKLYFLLNISLVNIIILILGIVYAMKGNGTNTSTLFDAGMISLTIILYLLTWPNLFKMLYLRNKSISLISIIICGFFLFPITPILLIIYLIGNFDNKKQQK